MASEWCPAAVPAYAATRIVAVTSRYTGASPVLIGSPRPGIVVSQTEASLRLRRPRHPFLVIPLPDLRPWAAEDVGHAELYRLSWRNRRGMAVDRKALRHALHDRERLGVVPLLEPIQVLQDAKRRRKRLVVVQHRLLREADERAGSILPWRVDLDRLEPAAEFEPALRDPALNVRRPGDQRIAVPEADRFA